ncbi:unnamed protein product [Closterium sp. NIES-65]|nr:unnamed protein product [Closterium sp. NIES-65]
MLIPLRRLAQHPSDTAAHLILLAFPRLVLRLTAATPSQSLTAACALLAQRFISGDWHALFLEASAAATPAARPLNLASARSTATQARLHRAARFAKCGDWSRSLAALEAGEFAPPSSETISSLSSKHPPAPQPLPHWISTFTPDSYPQLSAPLLHLALRSAPRGTAAGPSGCLFYSSPSPLHYRNGPTLHTFESASGVRQGDPCGPFLYALTQQLAILPTQNQFPSIFISSYADDTFLVGPPSIITTAFTALTDRLHSLGLTVQPSKCSIWCPLDWPQGCATPSGVPIAPNGLNVAGVPIGSDGYIISTVQEKLASFTTSLPLLHQLHDPQTASRILSQCVSARPSFLLRTVSPFPEIHDLFSSWDSTLLDHFTQLFGPGYWIPDTEQTKTAQQQVFLPVRLGGFGLRSSASTAPLSYLCSWAQSLPLLSTHFITDGSPLFRPFLSSDTIHRLDEFIPAATAMLPKEVRDRFPSWSHLLPGYPPKLFTHLSQQLEASLLEKVRSSVTSPLRLARLTSLQGPHAGDWLTAAPSSPQLQLTESEWRIAAAIRLGLPIPHLSSAETCACGHPFSDSSLPSHALRCPKNNEPTRVHDAIKHELHRIILELGLVSQLEDHHLLPGRRPDITCRDLQSGTTLALDVSVADSQHGFPHSNAATVIGSAAATRETEKATLYAPSLHARPDVKLLPLALETFGNNAQSHVSRPSVAVQGKARSAVVPVASCAARAGGCRAWSSVGRGNGWQQMPAHVAETSEAVGSERASPSMPHCSSACFYNSHMIFACSSPHPTPPPAGNRHAFIRAQSGSGTAVGIVVALLQAIHSSALFSPSAPPLALTFLSDSTPHRYPLSPAALSALIRPAGLEVGAGLEEQRAGAGGKHGRESRAEVGYDPWMQFLMGSPGPPMELDAPARMHGGDSLTCHRLPCPDPESLDLMLRAMARDGRDLFDLLRLVRLTHAAMDRSHADMNGSHADMDRAHADAASMHLDMAEGNPAPAATAHEAGSSSKQSPPRTHTLSPSAYSSLIRACVNGGQVKEARRLLRDMERRGVPPTQAAVNMIAHMHFLHADPDAALSLLHHVRAAQKLPMNAALLTTYVWGLGQAGRVEEAEELLLGAVGGGGGMVGRNGGNGGEGGDGGDGEGMRVAAVQPNVRTWNALMHGYALKGDADAAEGVLGLMRGEGGVMSGGERFEAGGEGELGVGGNVVGAGVGEEEEDEDGGESDGTAEGFWDGDEEYEEGERAGEVRDAEEAGEFSMRREHHLCHQQQQHQQQHEAERPPKRKARFPWPSVRPNTVTYTTLMAAYAAAGRSAEVWDVYREMRSLSIPPNHFTFATLVSSCAARSRPDLIKSVLADVAACQQRADVALVTSVLAGVAGCCSGKKEEAGSVLRWFLGEVESEGGVGEACARLILEDGLSDAQVVAGRKGAGEVMTTPRQQGRGGATELVHLDGDTWQLDVRRLSYGGAAVALNQWLVKLLHVVHCNDTARRQVGSAAAASRDSVDERSRSKVHHQRDNPSQRGGGSVQSSETEGEAEATAVAGAGAEGETGAGIEAGGPELLVQLAPAAAWQRVLVRVTGGGGGARRKGAPGVVVAPHQVVVVTGQGGHSRWGGKKGGGQGEGRVRQAVVQEVGRLGLPLGVGGAGAAAWGEVSGVWAGPGGVAERPARCCHAATRGP